MPLRAIIKKCSFVGCTNNSKEKKSLKFFNFRKHDYRKWMTVCEERLEKLNEVVILSHNHVCEKHFKRTHFHMYLSPHRRLTKDAFPVQDTEAASSWDYTPAMTFSDDIMEKVLSLGKAPVKTDPPAPAKPKVNIKREVNLEDFYDSDDTDDEDETGDPLSIDTLKKYTRKDHSYIRQRHTASPMKNLEFLKSEYLEMAEGIDSSKFNKSGGSSKKSSNTSSDVKPPIFLVAIPSSSSQLMLGNTLLPMDPPKLPSTLPSTSSNLDPSSASTSSTTETTSSSTDTPLSTGILSAPTDMNSSSVDTISSTVDPTSSSTNPTSSTADPSSSSLGITCSEGPSLSVATSTSTTVSIAISSTPPSIHASSTIPSSIVITSVASTAVTKLSSRSMGGHSLRPIAARKPIPQNDITTTTTPPQTYKVLSLPPNMLLPLTFVPPNLNASVGTAKNVLTLDDNVPKKAGILEKGYIKAYKLKIEKLEKQMAKLLSRPCMKCKRRKAKDWQDRNNPKFVKPPVAYNPKRFPIEQFCHKFGEMLGPYLTEVVRMQLNRNRLKIMRYTRAQLWLAASIMKGVERYGYRYLIRLFPFPARETIRRELDRRKKDPNCKSELLWFDDLVDNDSDDCTNKNDENADIVENNLGTSSNAEDEAAMSEFFENHFVFDAETGKLSSSSEHPDVASKILRAEGTIGRSSQNDVNKPKKRQASATKKSAAKRFKKNPSKPGVKRQKTDKNGMPIVRKERKKRNVGPENEHERAQMKMEREIINKRKRSLAAHNKRKKFKPLWSLYESNEENVATIVTKELPADIVDIVVETVDKSRNPPMNPPTNITTEEVQGNVVATISNEAAPSYFNSDFVFEGYADEIPKTVDKGDNSKVGEFIYKEFASKPNEGGISGQIAYQKSNVELEEEHVDMPLVVSYHDGTGT